MFFFLRDIAIKNKDVDLVNDLKMEKKILVSNRKNKSAHYKTLTQPNHAADLKYITKLTEQKVTRFDKKKTEKTIKKKIINAKCGSQAD